MNINKSPFKCHIFICVNNRNGERKSCADGENLEIASLLKSKFKESGIAEIRVSKSLCLGLCEKGPNILVYPQGIWFSGVSKKDLDQIYLEIIKLIVPMEQ